MLLNFQRVAFRTFTSGTLWRQQDSAAAASAAENSLKSQARVDDLIRQDHSRVLSLYEAYQSQCSRAEREKIANEIIRQLTLHAMAEEILVYPLVEKSAKAPEAKPSEKEVWAKLREDHQKLKRELKGVDKYATVDFEYDLRLEKLMKDVKAHADDEENRSLLPYLRSKLNDQESQKLGKDFEDLKKKMPTRPHLWTPNNPQLEKLAASVLAPLDRFRDAFREFPDGDVISKKIDQVTRKVDDKLKKAYDKVYTKVAGPQQLSEEDIEVERDQLERNLTKPPFTVAGTYTTDDVKPNVRESVVEEHVEVKHEIKVRKAEKRPEEGKGGTTAGGYIKVDRDDKC